MNEKTLDKLIRRAFKPVPDVRLEALQAKVHGVPGHAYIRLLYWLSLELEPPLALELGTEWGITSRHLCAAADLFDGVVAGVDHTVGDRVHRPNYHHFRSSAVGAFEGIAALGLDVGLVFQDTWHAEQVEEWHLYSSLLRPGAVWILDDVKGNRNWDKIGLSHKRMVEDLHSGVAMGIGWVER